MHVTFCVSACFAAGVAESYYESQIRDLTEKYEAASSLCKEAVQQRKALKAALKRDRDAIKETATCLDALASRLGLQLPALRQDALRRAKASIRQRNGKALGVNGSGLETVHDTTITGDQVRDAVKQLTRHLLQRGLGSRGSGATGSSSSRFGGPSHGSNTSGWGDVQDTWVGESSGPGQPVSMNATASLQFRRSTALSDSRHRGATASGSWTQHSRGASSTHQRLLSEHGLTDSLKRNTELEEVLDSIIMDIQADDPAQQRSRGDTAAGGLDDSGLGDASMTVHRLSTHPQRAGWFTSSAEPSSSGQPGQEVEPHETWLWRPKTLRYAAHTSTFACRARGILRRHFAMMDLL